MTNFISINIIYLRKTNFLTQPEFADIFGINRDSVSAIENEKKKLFEIELLQKIATHFNISIDDFINKDLSKLKKDNYYVEEVKEPYHKIDKKTETMMQNIIDSQTKTIESKDQTITEKEKLIVVLEKTIDRLEALLNQNGIN